jgi:hypothetical protein
MTTHKDSIHLTANEYSRLYESKWLTKHRGFKVDKLSANLYRLTADWPEEVWAQLEETLSAM